MTDLTIKSGSAEELKGYLDTLVAKIQATKTEMTSMLHERDAKQGQLADEVKRFGSEFGDTKAKLGDMAQKLADSLGQLTKAQDAIDRITADMHKPHDVKTSDESAAQRKHAVEFYKLKHHAMDTMDAKSRPFDAASVTDDKVTAYDHATKAWARFLRAPSSEKHPQMNMTADEVKGISTLTHGNAMWLPMEMSSQMIECFEQETDLAQFFSSISISGAGIQMLRKGDVTGRAVWRCEADCTQKALEITQPGLLTIVPGELSATVCATHSMLEDSAVDLEGIISRECAEQFVNSRNDAFFGGSGNGMPNGGLKPGQHLEMPSGQVAGTPSGEFSWQDLVAMKWTHQPRFRSNRSWFMHRDAIAATMTMSDGNGRPIYSEQTINADGVPSLLGLPMRDVTQMPGYLDAAGDKVIGSKPIALGDWKKWYLVVERKGFSVLRDPYSQAICGIVWHFTQKVGGDVLCPEAAIFLKIV